jgi:YVTN family beta-propeller protein
MRRISPVHEALRILAAPGRQGESQMIIRGGVRPVLAFIGIVAATVTVTGMAAAQAATTGAAAAGRPHVTATIPLGRQPENIATDPVTGMVYVTEPWRLTVIDGRTNSVVTTLRIPSKVFNVAADPLTGVIYVTDPFQGSVLAIRERTNTIVDRIKVGGGAFWVATNPLTGRVYAHVDTASGREFVAVINSRTSKVITRIPTGSTFIEGIAVNSLADTVYVNIGDPNAVLVIDGRTDKVIATIPDVSGAEAATDPLIDTVYVTEPSADGPGLVYVINGRTNTVTAYITSTTQGIYPDGIASDPLTHFVYAANYYGNDVIVINGRTSKVTGFVPVGHNPRGVATNPLTNTVYVTNTGSRSVSVLAGHS